MKQTKQAQKLPPFKEAAEKERAIQELMRKCPRLSESTIRAAAKHLFQLGFIGYSYDEHSRMVLHPRIIGGNRKVINKVLAGMQLTEKEFIAMLNG